jgi:hypothetical protein
MRVQSAVAEVVAQAVGVEQPVLTGVRAHDDTCMAVTVLSGTDYSGLQEQTHLRWDEVDCHTTALPTLCRQGNPTRGASGSGECDCSLSVQGGG